MSEEPKRDDGPPVNRHLYAFLWAAAQPTSALSKLRYNHDLLRVILSLACEEWWALHIHRGVPKLFCYRGRNVSHPRRLPPEELLPMDHIPDLSDSTRRFGRDWQPPQPDGVYSGVAMAVLATGLSFPPPTEVPPNSYKGQVGSVLNVNMMPFWLGKPRATLPTWCHGYVKMIEKCTEFMEHRGVGYLTIDEREVALGQAQRRPGLHVESSFFPLYPRGSARHVHAVSLPWGRGPMRQSWVKGGIFVCSTVDSSTAVWNCHVVDDQGSVVHPHGGLEHCRALLRGVPCKRLGAGELVWMTDRTPHESLRMPEGGRRQFFRLVVGRVGAWYAEHNTPNPTGYTPPPEYAVPVVEGNKFTLLAPLSPRWEFGTEPELEEARRFHHLWRVLHVFELGHLAEKMRECGIGSVEELLGWRTKLKSLAKIGLWKYSYCDTDDPGVTANVPFSEGEMIKFMIGVLSNPEQNREIQAHLLRY
eukprot:RCo020866